MAKVYIANCTFQQQIINVRMPESRKPISMTIPMGQQRDVGDLTTPMLDSLVDQLGPYGLYPAEGIKRAETKITYIYAVGRYVKGDEIRMALDRNQGVLREEGVERRKHAAIASAIAMDTEQTPLNKLDMSIEEESSSAHFSSESEEQVNEGFRVDNTANTNENTKVGARNAGKNKK